VKFILNPNEPLTRQCRSVGLDQRGAISGVRLYRFRDEHGGLLYVGVTSNFPERWQGHKRSAKWWPLVHTAEVSDRFPYMNAALDAELIAIRTENPQFNRRSSLTNHGAVSERLTDGSWEEGKGRGREGKRKGRSLVQVPTNPNEADARGRLDLQR
jgi:hypothetical protein